MSGLFSVPSYVLGQNFPPYMKISHHRRRERGATGIEGVYYVQRGVHERILLFKYAKIEYVSIQKCCKKWNMTQVFPSILGLFPYREKVLLRV